MATKYKKRLVMDITATIAASRISSTTVSTSYSPAPVPLLQYQHRQSTEPSYRPKCTTQKTNSIHNDDVSTYLHLRRRSGSTPASHPHVSWRWHEFSHLSSTNACGTQATTTILPLRLRRGTLCLSPWPRCGESVRRHGSFQGLATMARRRLLSRTRRSHTTNTRCHRSRNG